MPYRRSLAARLRALIPLAALALALPAALRAAETVDLAMMSRIRDEGFHRSQAMDIVGNLTDRIGPRLTGSPALRQANDWVLEQFKSWGFANTHLEPFPFGRGWSLSRSQVTLLKPRMQPLLAYPKAWTPGTHGPLRGEAMAAKIETEKDLPDLKGKVAGKIIFISDKVDFTEEEMAHPDRYDRKGLDDLAQFEIPGDRDPQARVRAGLERLKRRAAINEFLKAEKVLAVVDVSGRTDGIIRVAQGGGFTAEDAGPVPAVTMAAEHYNSILRLLDQGEKVELELDIESAFNDAASAYNTVGEIPGTDKADELVIAGGHLDSWHSGTGATDNAVGCAVVMEAVRILKAIGVKPRRTIRAVLWAGEEQGLLGSKAYVAEHFASRPETTDENFKKIPAYFRPDTWPITPKPEHAKVAGYFNLDNGTGKIRGIYTEENAAVQPIFEAWLAPFRDLGADTITSRHTGGTDHNSFNGVGLPGFQFIQDQMSYETKTHHTNLDTYDHLRREDVMQAAVIMAAFLYNTAQRDEMLPRLPLPQEPPAKKKPAGKPDAPASARPGV
jgi:carboxypeptidase Q